MAFLNAHTIEYNYSMGSTVVYFFNRTSLTVGPIIVLHQFLWEKDYEIFKTFCWVKLYYKCNNQSLN